MASYVIEYKSTDTQPGEGWQKWGSANTFLMAVVVKANAQQANPAPHWLVRVRKV